MVTKVLSLSNIVPICTRAEEYANVSRETFDVCTSRAVSSLNILDEISLPFVKTGGKFIAMKAAKGTNDYMSAQAGIAKLGGELSKVANLTLSLRKTEIERELYIISKIKQTPIEYPRNYSRIIKKPL